MNQFTLLGLGLLSTVAFVKTEPCYHPGMTGLVVPNTYKGQILVGFWHQQKNVRVGSRQEFQSVISMEAVTQLEDGEIRSAEPIVLISEKFNMFYHYSVDFIDQSTLVVEVHTQLPGMNFGVFSQFRFDTSSTPPKLIRRYSGNMTTYAVVTFVDSDKELVRCGERKTATAGAKSCFKFDSVAGVYKPWSNGMQFERHQLYSQFVKVGTHQCIYGSVSKSKIECIDPSERPPKWNSTVIQTTVDRFRGSVTKGNMVYLLPYQIGGASPFKMEKLGIDGNNLVQDQYMMIDLGSAPKDSREYVLFNGEKTIIVRDRLRKSTFMWDVHNLGPRVNLSSNDWWYTFSMDQCSDTDPGTDTTTSICECPILARPPDNCRYKIVYDSNNCPIKWDLICDECPDTTDTPTISYACENITKVREVILAKHNELRKQHSVPPMKQSPEINDYAQEWAEYMAKNNVMKDRFKSQFAFNQEMIGSSVVLTGDALLDRLPKSVEAWYTRGSFGYNYENPHLNSLGRNSRSDNFIKIIWKSTESIGIGCGLSARKQDSFIVVNYPRYGVLMSIQDYQALVKVNVLPPAN